MDDDFFNMGDPPPGPADDGRGHSSGVDLRDLSAAGGISLPGLGEEPDVEPAPAPPMPMPTPEKNGLFPTLPKFGTRAPSAAVPIFGAVGAGVAGGLYAGAWGAAAGVTASGAIVNLIRYATTKSSDPQAASAHLVFAVVSGVAAAYTGRKAYLERKERTTRTRPVRSNKEMPPWLKPTS